jgi:Protein of unknown function (DUF3105)
VAEVLAIAIASLVLSIGLIVLLSGSFAGRDQGVVSAAGAGPGQAYADLGHPIPGPGERVRYDSIPPTSGAHLPATVGRDGAALNDDQLLQALQVGDVVLMYGSPQPPPGLTQLASSMAPRFSPALADAGQAVILATRPGTSGIVGLAWTHLIRVRDASDPALRAFATFWLGRGAPTAQRPVQRR